MQLAIGDDNSVAAEGECTIGVSCNIYHQFSIWGTNFHDKKNHCPPVWYVKL